MFGTVGDFSGFCAWNDKYDDHYSVYDYSEDFDSSIRTAEVFLDGGVGDFSIRGNSHDLFNAKARGRKAIFDVTTRTEDDHAVIEIDQTKTRFDLTEGGVNNKLDLKLNPNPEWELNLNIDAAKADFDLRELSVRRFTLKSGAAEVTARFGENQTNSNITIKLGAEALRLYFPEEAGIRLRGKMALILKDFDGLREISDDYYESDNLDTAEKFFDVEISGGISSLKLIRN